MYPATELAAARCVSNAAALERARHGGKRARTEVQNLVDPARPDQRGVELLRVVGRHHEDAVRRVHDAVEHVEQACTPDRASARARGKVGRARRRARRRRGARTGQVELVREIEEEHLGQLERTRRLVALGCLGRRRLGRRGLERELDHLPLCLGRGVVDAFDLAVGRRLRTLRRVVRHGDRRRLLAGGRAAIAPMHDLGCGVHVLEDVDDVCARGGRRRRRRRSGMSAQGRAMRRSVLALRRVRARRAHL